jgi:His/Glu/Gln/Arg/opine family amino acid ABC transporter permease subunit
MKKILSVFFIFLLILTSVFSLSSCEEKEYTLGSAKEVRENLEHNAYTLKYTSSAEKLEEIKAGLSEKVDNYVYGKKGAAEITLYYCKSEAAASECYNEFVAFSNQNTKIKYTAGIQGSIAYLASENAVQASCEKFSRLYLTFVEEDNYLYILKGLRNTLLITLGALAIGVVLGALVAVAKYYADGNPKLRFINIICDLYTTVIRGIPITVLLFIFFFIILVSADGMWVAIIAFGINSGAYMAELVRSGINAVDKGQMEAARSLGMSKWQAMKTVVFPQAVKNVLPAIGNECIALLKETSVAGYVAVVDLTRGANLIRNNTYDAVNPLILTALIYLGLVIIMTKLLSILEKRLRKSEKH